jgi:hypothetical protein
MKLLAGTMSPMRVAGSGKHALTTAVTLACATLTADANLGGPPASVAGAGELCACACSDRSATGAYGDADAWRAGGYGDYGYSHKRHTGARYLELMMDACSTCVLVLLACALVSQFDWLATPALFCNRCCLHCHEPPYTCC